jgi:hypothetical protein
MAEKNENNKDSQKGQVTEKAYFLKKIVYKNFTAQMFRCCLVRLFCGFDRWKRI